MLDARPVATADTRILEVPGPLGTLLEGGVRRGSTLVIGSPAGGVSLALTLAAAATRRGGDGRPRWGSRPWDLRAAAELGVGLERLALVPAPGSAGRRWSPPCWTVWICSFSGCPPRVRPADARRLVARTRERGTVLVVLEHSGLAMARGA